MALGESPLVSTSREVASLSCSKNLARSSKSGIIFASQFQTKEEKNYLVQKIVGSVRTGNFLK